jgi:hypothetical protein
VAGLWEKEEKEETMEAKSLGLVLHRAMELLYADRKVITQQQFASLHEDVIPLVDIAIKDKFADPDDLEGKNVLIRNVIVELVRQILRQDEKHAPLEIVELESKNRHVFSFAEGKNVVLYGVIDRVDRVRYSEGDLLRVIDYKTGKVDFRKLKDPDELFRLPKHKEQFQAMLYAWFLTKKHPGVPVQVGLVTLREMTGGMKLVNADGPLDSRQLSDFEAGLRRLISEIFDPAIPFRQTEDEANCTYCPFKDICNR